MEEAKLFVLDSKSSLLYIEYGAGRSGLSTFAVKNLIESDVDKSKVNFLAIDRIPIKKKLDREIKTQGFE